MWTLDQFLKLAKAEGSVAKAMASIDGQEVVDADGNPVDIQTIDLGTGGGGEDEAATEPAEQEAAPAADIEKAVKAALEKATAGAPITSPIGKAKVVPAKARRCRVKNFTGPDAEFKAFGLGQVVAAAKGNTAAKNWLSERGLYKVQQEGDDSLGGVLVPEEFSADIIRLVETYGVFRRNTDVVPMTSDTLRTPRVVSERGADDLGHAAHPARRERGRGHVRR
jgi:HK97 family phage major capsid protein